MTSELRKEFIAWLKKNPKPVGYKDWNQRCALGMYRFNAHLGWAKLPVGDVSSARTVALGSGKLDTDPTTAKIGDWHYWGDSGYGHVGQDLEGGGTHVGMLGTTHLDVAIISWGGISSVRNYGRATGLKYLGHASNYKKGKATLPKELATAGVGTPHPVLETTRVVLSTKNAARHTGPGADYPSSGTALPAKARADFVAFAHGTPSKGGNVKGNDVWFQGASGSWFWSGNFSSHSTKGLKNLTAKYADKPKPPPVVVVPPVATPQPPVIPTPVPQPWPTVPVQQPANTDATPGWFTKFLKAMAAFFTGYKG